MLAILLESALASSIHLRRVLDGLVSREIGDLKSEGCKSWMVDMVISRIFFVRLHPVNIWIGGKIKCKLTQIFGMG